jgi:transcriptional regulator with XRE-family HTH domain
MSEGNIGNSQQQIAAELKRVRESAGLSQEQMARRLGMDYAPKGRNVSTGRAAVSAWERGRRIPSTQYLQAYVALGGNPVILTLPGSRPRELQSDVPVAEPMTKKEPLLAVSAGLPLASGRIPRRVSSRLWLAFSALVAAAAAGAALAFFAFQAGPSGPASTWTETTGTPAHTWADATQLTGAGTPLGPRQSVQVLCRVRGYVVQDGDPWWYLLASTPWNGHYYATSDAFYNNGATSGPVDNGVVVDQQVPVCQGS